MKNDSRASNIIQARQYVKDNIWKQIGKQKILELILIPIAIFFIIKIPLWVGKIISKVIGIERFTRLIHGIANDPTKIISTSDYWIIGLMFIIIVGGFIFINYFIAKYKVESDAREKFDITYFDLL